MTSKRREPPIITAWAEYASGPGWSNAPVCYIWKGDDGQLQRGWLQRDDQTCEMKILYSISAEVSAAMSRFVENALKSKRRHKRLA